MKTLILTAAVALVAVTTTAGTAEARCYRAGHRLSCTHHRHHYAHWRTHRWYGYASYYGSSYPYYGSSYYYGTGFGPRPNGGTGGS